MTQYSIYEGNMDRLEKKLLNGFSQSIKMNKVLSYSEVSFQRLRHPVHLHQESMYALDVEQSLEQQRKLGSCVLIVNLNLKKNSN